MIFTETHTKRLEMPSCFNINLKSYEALANIQRLVLDSEESKVLLDFTNTNYIDAIYMAFLGGLRELSKEYNKNLGYCVKQGTKLYNYFKSSGLYEYIKQGGSYANKNSIPFSEIHMEEESMVEYINKILDLAPITLSPKAESHLLPVFTKFSPTLLIIRKPKAEFLHVATGCPPKTVGIFRI